MALGGVATGNMKANEQATAVDIIRVSGLLLMVMDCNKNFVILIHFVSIYFVLYTANRGL